MSGREGATDGGRPAEVFRSPAEVAMAATPRFDLQEHQLFWNEQGSVVCACCHIPYPGCDTWVWERWEEITPETMAEIDRQGGRVACEGCCRKPSRIVR